MKNSLYLLIVSFLLSSPAFAKSKVLKTSTKAIMISHSADHLWEKGEKVCVYRGKKRLRCGKVTKVKDKFAIVRINNKKKQIKKGYIALLRGKKPSNRGIASGSTEAEVTSKRKTTKSIDLTGGLSANTTLFNPYLSLQFAVSDHIAVGLRPHFFILTNPNTSLTSFGGFLTANYYSKERYKGLWVQAGGGVYLYSAKDLTNTNPSESYTTIAGVLTAGWRLRFKSGFNIGVGAGVQYLADFGATSAIVVPNFTGFRPIANLDAGFTF